MKNRYASSYMYFKALLIIVQRMWTALHFVILFLSTKPSISHYYFWFDLVSDLHHDIDSS